MKVSIKIIIMKSGFLLVDKPKDWTSHDVVAYIRGVIRRYYKKMGLPAEARRAKAGHAGTLDPFATGLLIVGIGRDATKRLDEFKSMPKEYIATIKLGATSDTYDNTGQITMHDTRNTTKSEIQSTLSGFKGKQEQLPPMFSAKKIRGKKLYELARKGIEIDRKPHEIEVYQLDILEYDKTCSMLRASCLVSAGTYIRTLAHDIGEKLGTGAYCDELRRTKIGDYSVEDAVQPKNITVDNVAELIFSC